MKGWTTTNLPQGVVTRPDDDIVVHTHTEVCVCAPLVDKRFYTCGCSGYFNLAMRKVIMHQAMDGRE